LGWVIKLTPLIAYGRKGVVMDTYRCELTGIEFVKFQAKVLAEVREFSYQGDKTALNLSVETPIEVFGKKRNQRIDLVCFTEDEISKIVKLGLKRSQPVELIARRTERGLALDSASDIQKIKAI
jgi:hypothetical protein